MRYLSFTFLYISQHSKNYEHDISNTATKRKSLSLTQSLEISPSEKHRNINNSIILQVKFRLFSIQYHVTNKSHFKNQNLWPMDYRRSHILTSNTWL